MTSRERLLTTLKHGKPDRIPWWGMFNAYFFNNQKEHYEGNEIDFLRKIKADIFYKKKFSVHFKNLVVETYIDNKLFKVNEAGEWLTDDYLLVEYFKSKERRVVEKKFITPVGVLTTKFEYTPKSQTVFISDHLIKKVEDYNILLYMIEDLDYLDIEQVFEERKNEKGQEGIIGAFLHSTPIYELIYLFLGLERFHYFFNDYKKETINLINCMLEKYLQVYKMYSRYDSLDIIWIPEDASTTLYSPDFFNTYLKPILKKYCDVIKKNGKIAMMHACGRLKNILEPIREIGLDCIESATPYPIGDIEISDLKKSLPGVCIMGGIHALAWSYELDDFKEYIKGLILKNKRGGNFILSSSDSVPADANMENIMMISDLVNKYGRYN